MGQTSSFLRNLKTADGKYFLTKQLHTGSHDTATNYCVQNDFYKVAIYLFNGDAGMINLVVVELFFSTDSNLQSII